MNSTLVDRPIQRTNLPWDGTIVYNAPNNEEAYMMGSVQANWFPDGDNSPDRITLVKDIDGDGELGFSDFAGVDKELRSLVAPGGAASGHELAEHGFCLATLRDRHNIFGHHDVIRPLTPEMDVNGKEQLGFRNRDLKEMFLSELRSASDGTLHAIIRVGT